MCQNHEDVSCGSLSHVNRRTLLKASGLAGLTWLTPLSKLLARQEEESRGRKRPRSVIVLWMEGGASQLETFDPHPNTEIAAGSKAIKTCLPDVMLGEGLPQLAEMMNDVSIVRSVTSKEGDHERAIYNVKTGFRPDPTLLHPSIGAVMCHELGDPEGMNVEIPRHVSILANQNAARGGYLGDQYDAFKVYDPQNPVPDVQRAVDEDRFDKRLADLRNVLEPEFSRGRHKRFQPDQLLDHQLTDAAVEMMSSDQLKAFDVSSASKKLREDYGNTAFGRGCLTAVRLIETGVRCVEVTLTGWDSHAKNHEIQGGLIKQLDPAFATLIKDLKDRDLFDDTIIVCGSEFGRTPEMNPAGGRDHWPHGFSIALAGGGIQGGRIIGETSPTPFTDTEKRGKDLVNPQRIENIHATIFDALGVDVSKQYQTPIGRPMYISEGTPIKELLES